MFNLDKVIINILATKHIKMCKLNFNSRGPTLPKPKALREQKNKPTCLYKIKSEIRVSLSLVTHSVQKTKLQLHYT